MVRGQRDRISRGFSLTELLVASTIGLAVMAMVASLFSVFGAAARTTEAIAAMTDGLRTTAIRLRDDLTGVTADLAPPNAAAAGIGYFEYIEGWRRDFHTSYSTSTPQADTDDVLLFTTRSDGKPFNGRFTMGAGTPTVTSFESPFAEVAWFCKDAPDSEQVVAGLRLQRLYRRQLLVAPYVGQPPFTTAGAANALNNSVIAPNLATAYLNFDLSLRSAGAGAFATNSLGDLSRRENRFLHNVPNLAGIPQFPFIFAGASAVGATFDGTNREGEDVVLGNVIAFDVRAFDPEAPIRQNSSSDVILQPGDPGYGSQTIIATGAYADLGWGIPITVTGNLATGTLTPSAVGAAFPPSGVSGFQSSGVLVVAGSRGNLGNATYDTWTTAYENNGLNEDNDTVVDEGTNGFDDNGDGVVDDPSEYETSPPYPLPLRGIEVRIRCYDPKSQQVRQITVRHSFMKK